MLNRKNASIKPNLDYLSLKPKRINWQAIAGPKAHPIQLYDLVYDEVDFKIRKLPY